MDKEIQKVKTWISGGTLLLTTEQLKETLRRIFEERRGLEAKIDVMNKIMDESLALLGDLKAKLLKVK